MNNKGITYFRLNSPYDGDITKNCALDGYEVDNNFFTLEGRDIKCVYVENDEIKIELINGRVIKSGDVFSNFAKDLSFEFDSENGILYVKQNGQVQKIEGFVTEYGINGGVATNNTLEGKGKPSSPLSVSPVYRPGVFTPVKKLIDLTSEDCNCGCEDCTQIDDRLPKTMHLLPGDRFLVHTENSDYGMLYNYEGVKKIACDLLGINSPWRIPTKEDWDDMLNAVEPCEADRTHTSASSNTWLGRFAGKFLKNVHLWRSEGCINNGNANTCFDYSVGEDTTEECECGRSDEECNPSYCGEYNHCHRHKKCSHKGIDKYGFAATPAGYADDGLLYGYFGERGMFWTATVSRNGASAYAKRFDYNKSNVYQDIVPGSIYLSLRLVKDYDGSNYYQRERILGDMYPTVLMPSLKCGNKVWTSVNIALTNRCYRGIIPNDGQGVTMIKKYFIYEWDGHKFLTNELREGEIVTIFDSPNNRYSTAYKLVNGELIDLELRIVDNVLTLIRPELDNIEALVTTEKDRAMEAEGVLGNRITEETEARIAADEILNTAIGEETEARTAKDTEHDEKIAQLEAKDSEITDKITELENKDVELDDKITEVDSKLTQEIADRVAADEEFDNKVTQEISDRIHADEILNNKLEEETTARTTNDEILNDKITQEIADRVAADETEAQTREEKDTEIEGKLITDEGTEFDEDSGILTLKSVNGTNDITVQFSFNFGEI